MFRIIMVRTRWLRLALALRSGPGSKMSFRERCSEVDVCWGKQCPTF